MELKLWTVNREIVLDNPHGPNVNTWVLKSEGRASLVAQWLRICLLMQGTQVRAVVWEDPTCRGATRPVSHGY